MSLFWIMAIGLQGKSSSSSMVDCRSAQRAGGGSEKGTHLIPIAVDLAGKRVPSPEKRNRECFKAPAGRALLDKDERTQLLHEHIEPTLQRELGYRGIANPDTGYATELLAWVEIE